MSENAQECAFVCPFCGRDYPDQDGLTEHFDSRHDLTLLSDD